MSKIKFLFSMLLLINAFAFSPIARADGITKRVKFARGKSTATYSYAVIRGDEDTYIVGAKAGQKMSVKITAVENNAAFQIEKPGGGYLKNAGDGDDQTVWTGTLPASGSYKISIGGTRGNATYKLTVSIKQLPSLMKNKMIISKSVTQTLITFFAVAILFFIVSSASAQTDSTPKKRLKSPATIKGVVGGEAHDSYVIRVAKYKTLRVEISWKKSGDFAAAFVISKSPDFFAGDVLQGGTESYSGKIRTVRVPATGDYYIYVTGHPTATYTLKISVK